MNPVFVFLVVIGSALVWFLLAFIFPLVGKIVIDMFEDFKSIVENDEKEDDEDER